MTQYTCTYKCFDMTYEMCVSVCMQQLVGIASHPQQQINTQILDISKKKVFFSIKLSLNISLKF